MSTLDDTVRGAIDGLDSAGREVILDFSEVRRLDPAGVKLIDELATRARDKQVRVSLVAVNVDVYKVLKLAQLQPGLHFSV